MTTLTHITASGGLISAAFIENVRQPGSRQRGVEPESLALPWSPASKSPAAMEETIAAAWELLLERWDAVRPDLPVMDVSQVRARWLLAIHCKGMGSFRLASGEETSLRRMRR